MANISASLSLGINILSLTAVVVSSQSFLICATLIVYLFTNEMRQTSPVMSCDDNNNNNNTFNLYRAFLGTQG